MGGLAASAFLPDYLSASDSKGRTGPNVVLIMADDLGYECIGANGGTSYETPALDGLARTGMRFEHCYAQPLCTPSRVKIMTGIYNVRNYIKFGVMERSQTTFAHLLKNKGYATCVAGKWQLGREPDSPRHFGFDESCLWQQTHGRTNKHGFDSRYENPLLDINGKTVNYTNGEFGPDVVSDYLCDFIERHKDKPFFAYYPMILTHCPFVPTPDSADWEPNSKGSKSYKGKTKFFADMVTYMDKMVGKVVAKLDELGLRESTLVIFTGDNGTDKPIVSMMNGEKIAGEKSRMTDGGTRVPLIANQPGVIPSGKVCGDLVDFSDFLPTLCELASAKVPENLNIEGRSFLPQLKGQKGNPRRWIYCWFARNGGPEGQQWARNQRYKLYADGKFYDVKNDRLEKKPLDTGNLLGEAKQTCDMLQKALDRYKNARPAEIAAYGKR